MLSKFMKVIAVSALITVTLFVVSAVSVSAEPPDEAIVFDPLIVTYERGNFTTVSGQWWSTEGIFAGSGTAVQSAEHAGWPGNGWQFQNAQLTTILSDNSGTVTIRDEVTGIIWDGLDFTASGRWVIVDATGAYEGLHGVGTSERVSTFHFVCPDKNVDGVCIINETYLNGVGHFDP